SIVRHRRRRVHGRRLRARLSDHGGAHILRAGTDRHGSPGARAPRISRQRTPARGRATDLPLARGSRDFVIREVYATRSGSRRQVASPSCVRSTKSTRRYPMSRERSSTMRVLIAVLTVLIALGSAADVFAQKPELTEVDAWLVRDPQMSAQFAVADQLGYFKQEGLKVNIRWYIAGTDLPSMWGAGNVHLGTATATMVVPIAASGQAIYNVAPQSDIGGVQQVILGKKAQEIVKSPKDVEKLKIGMPKGASVTMAIQNFCKANGVDFNKIQFVNLSPPDAITALAKGDIDAMAAWAPWTFRAMKEAGGKLYFTGSKSS